MKTKLNGKAWVYGDNVDTDVIIPARYLTTSDPAALAPHCMEDIDKEFASKVQKGDILVGGNNFSSIKRHIDFSYISILTSF